MKAKTKKKKKRKKSNTEEDMSSSEQVAKLEESPRRVQRICKNSAKLIIAMHKIKYFDLILSRSPKYVSVCHDLETKLLRVTVLNTRVINTALFILK